MTSEGGQTVPLQKCYFGSLLVPMGQGASTGTAVAQISAVVQVQSLAQELPHDMGMAKKMLLWHLHKECHLSYQQTKDVSHCSGPTTTNNSVP